MKKVMPPTYFISSMIGQIVLDRLIPLAQLIYYPYSLAGIIFIVIGIILNLWADQLFKYHQTTVKPFENSSLLLTTGPFQWTRNPMYLGMVLILFGIFTILGSLTSLLIIPVFIFLMQKIFVIPEERALASQFGHEYRVYAQKTRRWL